MTDSSFGSDYRRLDELAGDEGLRYLDDLYELPAVQAAKREATDALALRPGARVVEVGCGTGVDLPDLAERVRPGGSVLGIDPSSRALEAARLRTSGLAEVRLAAAGAESIPAGDEEVDACRTDRTLQHVADPEVALREFRRVLRPGGRLVVLEMTSELRGLDYDAEITQALRGRMWSAEDRPETLPLMLPLLLSRAGFSEIDFKGYEAQSSNLAEADTALRLRASLSEAVADGALTAERSSAWLSELRQAESSGTLVLHMHFSRISAVAA